uniref:Uncharacterized protein ycf23 n=1 Tax=Tolypiocladia glomerulata TaxID=860646 RepID=A0A1Z1MUQ2_9FLOR|nr:hypothetical protein [Tolypiocladia glomerulata]ARW69696.1 hypothetical protein [Tolypiocladia glomerulata]
MNLYNHKLQQSFELKSVIKVISGIDNTNVSEVIKIAKAVSLSKATYIDIAANPHLVKKVKSCSNLPVCISSVNIIDIYNCVLAGADLVELGNYDFFYAKGNYVNAKQILTLVKILKRLVGRIDLCVTVPYYLSLIDQVILAKDLELLGVNIIQSEGVCLSKKFVKNYQKTLGPNLDQSNIAFVSSLLSTYFISHFVDIPIISASGCRSITSKISTQYGASGIGIGSAIRKQKNIIDMVKYINQTYDSLSLYSENKSSNFSRVLQFVPYDEMKKLTLNKLQS